MIFQDQIIDVIEKAGPIGASRADIFQILGPLDFEKTFKTFLTKITAYFSSRSFLFNSIFIAFLSIFYPFVEKLVSSRVSTSGEQLVNIATFRRSLLALRFLALT